MTYRNRDEERKEVLKSITTRGLSGLSNLGNTCYMNSALQTLCATNELVAYLIHPESDVKMHLRQRIADQINAKNKNEEAVQENPIIKKKSHDTITYKLIDLYEHMWAYNCEVEPKEFKRITDEKLVDTLGKRLFHPGRQHDSQEFLSALLDKIHEETKSDLVLDYTLSPFVIALEQEMIQLKKEEDEQRKEIMTFNKNNTDKITSTKELNRIMMRINEIIRSNTNDYLFIGYLKALRTIYAKSYSAINDIFSSLILQTITCKVCDNSRYNFERYDLLTLHFPDNYKNPTIHLTKLLENYFSVDVLDGDDKSTCPTCNQKQTSDKSLSIYQPPEKLVVLIKKVYYKDNFMMRHNTIVQYEHTLDINPYLSTNVDRVPNYELYASIRHSGGATSGHYIAYTKNPINKKWFICDDGSVYGVDDNEVLKSNSYVLFYSKIRPTN